MKTIQYTCARLCVSNVYTLITDGSLLYERVPNKPEVDRLTLTPPQPQPVMSTQQNILKRTRPFDEINGSDGKF